MSKQDALGAVTGIATRVIQIDPRELKLLDLNARYMKSQTYTQLVANIKRDGVLTQIPFAWRDDDNRWEVGSGNHRTMAAIDAGLPLIDLQVTDAKLTGDQKRAIQLSHNALVGEDDPGLLKQLYEGIEDLDWRVYAGLDDVDLKLLQDVKVQPFQQARLDYSTVTLAFLPDELDAARSALKEALSRAKPDATWLARFADHARTLDALAIAADSGDVQNVATALVIILDVFNRHLEDLSDLWENSEVPRQSWVPIATILGNDRVPPAAARILKSAVEKVTGTLNLTPTNRWQAIEVIAREYMKRG